MAVGPVQLLVLGFNRPDFHGAVVAELERLRASGTVRVIDSLAVYKDAFEQLEVSHLSNASREEAIALGSTVGALIGLGIEGEQGPEPTASESLDALSDDDLWDVVEDIPAGSAAALILIEHQWAVGLQNAVVRAGGTRLGDGFISADDLVQIGLATLEEAAELEILETGSL